MSKIQSVIILGATGSIGMQTLEVVEANPDHFRCLGISGHTNISKLKEQIMQYHPKYVAISNENIGKELEQLYPSITFFRGEQAIEEIVSVVEAEIVVISITGIAALKATMTAIKHRKKIALSSKEVLVAAGKIVMNYAHQKNVEIYPIDSEHAAIDICLYQRDHSSVERIILTASGGPFWKRSNWGDISLTEALKHPNWVMGKKITIDSATMMNKGLEVIEAHWLFGLSFDQIDVLIHPQSLVHGIVEFKNGMMVSQMSSPDMRMPILYAISERRIYSNNLPKLELANNTMDFYKPDLSKFKCLKLAYETGRNGESWPVVLNGANEEAVMLCLQERLPFNFITPTIESVLSKHKMQKINTVDDVIEVDAWARRTVHNVVR